ncbi:MAG: hypothetical protein DMF82_07480 [Acidobacteria bacterium]|nr:MAG: hypothetical protein DMF82_07480 [Acidobacteriota bacterium]
MTSLPSEDETSGMKRSAPEGNSISRSRARRAAAPRAGDTSPSFLWNHASGGTRRRRLVPRASVIRRLRPRRAPMSRSCSRESAG